MENITYNQKIAVMKIILDLVMVDNYEDAREKEYFSTLMKEIDLDESSIENVKNQNSLLALLEIRDLDDEQKNEFACLMGQMIVADETIHYKEVELYNVVREFCKIPTELEDTFDVADYPELSFTEHLEF